MKRIALLQSGQYTGSAGIPICCDSDHDGLNEIIFKTSPANQPARWEIWEHHPLNFNQYQLVFADTGAYPGPPGITTGNFRPYDVGDIDRDGLIDLVGPNRDESVNHDTGYNVVTTQESPNYSCYPESLSWWYRHSYNAAVSNPFYFPPDLDSDNRNEIMFVTYPPLGVVIFENIANNQNVVAWNTTQGLTAWSFAFGDFDLDGHKEFVTAGLESSGRVYVYENSGDNQYERIYQDSVYRANGSDVFSGNDLDSDGRPEFFVAFYSYPSATNYLYMWEATANNTYQRTLIDQIGGGDWSGKRSICGDIDGDSIEELVWSIGGRVIIYKASGNNQFQRVWNWYNDHGGQLPTAVVNIYDMNKNGYKEVVIGGSGKTSIYEVEAVQLLRPNGGEIFQDSTQELIAWQKFYPPRCDSLSLFYSTDNGQIYLPLASCISVFDTSYVWTVPNINSDSCKVKIIAYGPGWQYDESDGNFSITSTGINEIATLPLAMTLGVKVYPNPTRSLSVIRYSLPVKAKVLLQLYDISGRLVKTLVDEDKKPGNYKLTLNTKTLSAGIYFISLKSASKRVIERLVIIK